VDHVREQWREQWPELNTTPVAVVARVGRLARYLDHGMDEVLARHGLRRESWDALASLRRAGPPYRLSPTQLYHGLMRSSGAMTNRLHRLADRGLVRRVPDPDDGRGMLVELTERGKALVESVAPDHVANEQHMLAALTPTQQNQLADLLRTLLLSFETGQSPPPPGP
jgi:DNA-binding MarR family transcriptional regulator